MILEKDIDWLKERLRIISYYGKASKMRKRDYDIRKRANRSLNRLIAYTEHMDEDQLIQVFTNERLRYFIKALMRGDKRHIDEKGFSSYERVFRIGLRFLLWSINITGSLLTDHYYKKLWQDRATPLLELARSFAQDIGMDLTEVSKIEG